MKKNILVMCPIYYPHYGGAEKAIFELYKGLSYKYNIDLLTPNFGSKKKEENNNFFTIHRVCKSSNNKVIKFIKYQLFQYLKARKLIKEKKYSLVHTHYIFPTCILGLLLKYFHKIPLVTTEHHFGSGMDIISEKENPRIINYFMKWYVNFADLLVSTGNTQNSFLRFLKDDLKFKTIELGGDCVVSNKSKYFLKNKFNIDKNKKIFFSISRIVKRKRYDIMLESLYELRKKKKDFICFIGGTGDELNNLKKLTKKFNLEKYVIFLGFLEDSLVEEYRKISDCFLSSSEFEGAGIIYFEAFASKTPLFAKINSSVSKIIQHKKNGFLYENSKELAQLLDTFAWNPKKLSKVSKEGYKDFQKKYNWSNYVLNYEKVYNIVIK